MKRTKNSVALRQCFALCVLLSSAAAAAEQETQPNGHIKLDETVISGNQELPKVLYIVPWQDPSGIPTIELDPNFTEHEVFRRLYPPAYQRELKYYDLLKASEGKE
jgi:hypothetical protein